MLRDRIGAESKVIRQNGHSNVGERSASLGTLGTLLDALSPPADDSVYSVRAGTSPDPGSGSFSKISDRAIEEYVLTVERSEAAW